MDSDSVRGIDRQRRLGWGGLAGAGVVAAGASLAADQLGHADTATSVPDRIPPDTRPGGAYDRYIAKLVAAPGAGSNKPGWGADVVVQIVEAVTGMTFWDYVHKHIFGRCGMTGSALGLHANGLKAMQAIGATLAGLTAQLLPVGTTMTMLVVASLAVTAILSPGLRLSDPRIAMRRATRREVTVVQLNETAA